MCPRTTDCASLDVELGHTTPAAGQQLSRASRNPSGVSAEPDIPVDQQNRLPQTRSGPQPSSIVGPLHILVTASSKTSSATFPDRWSDTPIFARLIQSLSRATDRRAEWFTPAEALQRTYDELIYLPSILVCQSRAAMPDRPYVFAFDRPYPRRYVLLADTGPVSNADFHPDLRRIARFTPRRLVGPWTLPLFRALTSLRERRTPSDVEVITVESGAKADM